MQSTSSLSVSTPSDREIVMTRSFRAPRRLVWDALTKPELVQRWMFVPPGWSWSECRMDVRVGGKFRWSWNGVEGQLALTISGEHKEVVPPNRIVHTELMEMGPGAGHECGGSGEPWTLLATIDLSEHADETLLKMTLLFPNQPARDAALKSGMEQGVAAGYDQLDLLLAASN